MFGYRFEFQDAVRRVTLDFPRAIYIATSGTSSTKNVAGIEFAFEEASYLTRMVTGATTKTGTIGIIGGTELPPVRKSFTAFALGAHAMNPGIKTVVSYIGNWGDVSAGKEQAPAQILRNIDIIFHNADAAGLGVFQAAKEARNARVIRSNSNQNNIAPDITIGSVIIDLPQAFLEVAREVKSEKFTPRVISLGLHDDIVRFVFNPRLGSTIPARIRAQVDSARDIFDGRTQRSPASP